MPFVIAGLGALIALYYFFLRASSAAHLASDLLGAATDVGLAAHRFRFRQKANTHPVESIEDERIAIAGLAAAFLELDMLPTKEKQERLTREIRYVLDVTGPEAVELLVLGRWLVGQCGTVDSAIARLSRKLFKLSGSAAVTPLLTIVRNTLAPEGETLNDRQCGALADVSRALRIH
ncbi:hypothetical protein [Pseudoruegeria sp. HB172150]|uniref:hypothetical protein n=1 Tax=Pseudoruegeria sp. HB172150 TaxID=2721164 RepID=UPI0015525D69|nr:hypothetical protein [Pseudoruegeria sp. HB172150]